MCPADFPKKKTPKSTFFQLSTCYVVVLNYKNVIGLIFFTQKDAQSTMFLHTTKQTTKVSYRQHCIFIINNSFGGLFFGLDKLSDELMLKTKKKYYEIWFILWLKKEVDGTAW